MKRRQGIRRQVKLNAGGNNVFKNFGNEVGFWIQTTVVEISVDKNVFREKAGNNLYEWRWKHFSRNREIDKLRFVMIGPRSRVSKGKLGWTRGPPNQYPEWQGVSRILQEILISEMKEGGIWLPERYPGISGRYLPVGTQKMCGQCCDSKVRRWLSHGRR